MERPWTISEAPAQAAAIAHPVIKVRDGQAERLDDHIAVEEPLEIRLAGRRLSVTMRTPGEDEELVAGFLYAEQLIRGLEDVDVIAPYRTSHGPAGNVVNVLLKGDISALRDRVRRNFLTSSSCGLCGKVAIEAVLAALPAVQTDLTVPLAVIQTLPGSLRAAQRTFGTTGGLHAAALFDGTGQLLVLREDIGRHNAVDKVVGHMLLAANLPLDRHMLMISGRASFEIMQKAAVAKVPMVVAVSAPSSLAVEFAGAHDMTLIGFIRGERLNVYAGAHRLSHLGAAPEPAWA